jgi:hypothetical protein
MSKKHSKNNFERTNTYGDSGFQIETVKNPNFSSKERVSKELRALGLLESNFSFPALLVVLLVLGLVLGGLYGSFESSNLDASANEIDLYNLELSKPLEVTDLR